MHQNRFPGRSPCYSGNITFVMSVVAVAVAAIAAYLSVLDNHVARWSSCLVES
jgi:hypothetical protein